jgi:hypothetical protein
MSLGISPCTRWRAPIIAIWPTSAVIAWRYCRTEGLQCSGRQGLTHLGGYKNRKNGPAARDSVCALAGSTCSYLCGWVVINLAMRERVCVESRKCLTHPVCQNYCRRIREDGKLCLRAAQLAVFFFSFWRASPIFCFVARGRWSYRSGLDGIRRPNAVANAGGWTFIHRASVSIAAPSPSHYDACMPD